MYLHGKIHAASDKARWIFIIHYLKTKRRQEEKMASRAFSLSGPVKPPGTSGRWANKHYDCITPTSHLFLTGHRKTPRF